MPKTHLEWQNFCPITFKIACSKKEKTNFELVVPNSTMFFSTQCRPTLGWFCFPRPLFALFCLFFQQRGTKHGMACT